jgi:predicted ferric reductase
MKIKLWSNSAEGWFEKAFSVVWVLGIAAWVAVHDISAWQIIHNQYQGHVKAPLRLDGMYLDLCLKLPPSTGFIYWQQIPSTFLSRILP